LKTYKFILKYENFNLNFYPESLLGKNSESKKLVLSGEALIAANNIKTYDNHFLLSLDNRPKKYFSTLANLSGLYI
jgi:hypothetical protein